MEVGMLGTKDRNSCQVPQGKQHVPTTNCSRPSQPELPVLFAPMQLCILAPAFL